MAMDNFPDRTHVSLWIREYEAYLFAREDGVGIACSEVENHEALHRAWAVHRLVRGDTGYVLFQSAAYGRYLAVVQHGAGCIPVQRTYDSPEQTNVLFQAVGAEDGSDDIHIRHFTFGVWCRPDDEDVALPGPWPFHWVVEAIPRRQFLPELPQPIPVNPPPAVPFAFGGPVCLGRRVVPAVQPQAVLRRTINYVQADDQGNFNPLQWRVLEQFEGQSVFNPRKDLADELGEADNGITLCA